jgi:hypothetical protein
VLLGACSTEEQLPPAEPGGDGAVPDGHGGLGSSSGGTSGPDETTSSDTGPPPCGETELPFVIVAPKVLFVLDASGSMFFGWDHDGEPETEQVTRWNSLHAVVTLVADEFDDDLDLGVLLFPLRIDESCEVADEPEVPVQSHAGPSILAAIPDADAVGTNGGTPTAEALQVGADHLHTLDDWSYRTMVLVTDGRPSCGAGADAAVEIVSDAHDDDGIDTYVVGIGIEADAAPLMSALAEAGGVPAPTTEGFYRGDDEATVEEALLHVSGAVKGCRAHLPREPDDPDLVILKRGDEVIPRVDDCENDEGWAFVHPDGPLDEIEICGALCEELLASGETITVVFPCAPGP